MNRNRWVILIIGALILVFGAFFSGIAADNKAKDANFFQQAENGRVVRAGDPKEKIVILPIHGTIVSNSVAGPFAADEYNQQALLAQIEQLKHDDNVAGVILEINSGGGETYASAQMYQALKKLKTETNLPIYVNMQTVAASGAYMIAMAGDKLFAHPETLTGSIGVILAQPNYSKFFEEHGISQNVYKSGAVKDMGTPFRDPTDEEKEIFQGLIDNSYENFVNIVAEGRDLSVDQVKKLADGRVYSAKQAQDNGLIDELGDQAEVIDALMKDQQLDNPQVVYSVAEDEGFNFLFNLFNRFIGGNKESDSAATDVESELLKQPLQGGANGPVLWSIYGG